MLLKDLTKIQILEIISIICDGVDTIPGYDVIYQPHDPMMFEDAQELWRISFIAKIFGAVEYNTMVEIDTKLNCWFSYQPTIGAIKSLPTHNQYLIQKKFREWGIYPNLFEQRECEIEKLL